MSDPLTVVTIVNSCWYVKKYNGLSNWNWLTLYGLNNQITVIISSGVISSGVISSDVISSDVIWCNIFWGRSRHCRNIAGMSATDTLCKVVALQKQIQCGSSNKEGLKQSLAKMMLCLFIWTQVQLHRSETLW